MPHKRRANRVCNDTPSALATARQYVKAGGINREDSDDELGDEDHPWQWIYSRSPPSTPRQKNSITPSLDIVGARMGDFECRIGDCVLLKAEGTKEAWVGLICNFIQEDHGNDDDSGYDEGQGTGMAANFMWFSTPKEIRNEKKRLQDAMPNEVYITPSWDINPLASVNGKASIMSLDAFSTKYPNGKIPRSSRDYGKTFVCRRGCNTRTATYTEDFNWETVFRGADDIHSLVERVKDQTKATRKRKREDFEQDNQEYVDQRAIEEPRTPSKKRKLAEPVTPASRPRSILKTPRSSMHKRVVMKKPLSITPLGTRSISSTYKDSTPYQLARNSLHVSSVPASLPCRENEFSTVYTELENAIIAGSGSCIYISGTPGTGKTATVREVIASLQGAVQAEELDDFIFVEINGMKVTDPTQSYSLLWEALRDERVSPSHALTLLEQEFSHPSPRRVPCVVLMDELDQLVTRTQGVMYNFFNWPLLRHSRLIVLAVANTMDLPERMLSNKISSRLGLTRILFPGYTHEQLIEIVRSRLASVPEDVMDKDAVQFAARKVAAVSGDARRCLDVCRRAVEIAEVEASETVEVSTPSKRSKRAAKQRELKVQSKSSGVVTIQTIKTAIHEATTSPVQRQLRGLSLASKVFLAALVGRMRRTGVNECTHLDVLEESRRLCLMAIENPRIQESLLYSDKVILQRSERHPKTTLKISPQAGRVTAISHAAIELADAGIIGLEGGRRRGERNGKLRLAIEDEEIGSAFRDCEDVHGLGL